MSLFRLFTKLAFPSPDKPNYKCGVCGTKTNPDTTHKINSTFVCKECFRKDLEAQPGED